MKKFLFLLLALVAAPAFAMPPVAIAAVSMYMAAGVVASGALVVGGMMMAGGMISMVGALSKDASLMKYGGLLSMAGGIGNMVAGAQSVASASAATDVASASEGAGAIGGEGLAETAVASPVTPGGEVATNPLDAATGAGAIEAPPPVEANQGLIDSNMGAPEANAMPGTDVQVDAYSDPSRGLDVPAAGDGQAAQATQAAGAQPRDPLRVAEQNAGVSDPGGAPAEKGVTDYLRMGSDFLKQNKEVANIGGKMLQGAMDDKSRREQQQRLWDKEAADRARYNQSVAGTNVDAFQVNTGANIRRTPPQNPVRFVPQRPPGA